MQDDATPLAHLLHLGNSIIFHLKMLIMLP